ncbi:MAG: transcription antitermination factor NusB [Acidimicrobiia bacterium]
MTATTREPREEALQVLYAADQGGDEPVTVGISKRARLLVSGVRAELGGLDEAIGAVSERWRVARMPAVDRNVMRIALYELLHRPHTPTAVILAEAVRIAKEYSTERSGAFVNGVLARLAHRVRGGAAGSG